jgi:hypothetical protein
MLNISIQTHDGRVIEFVNPVDLESTEGRRRYGIDERARRQHTLPDYMQVTGPTDEDTRLWAAQVDAVAQSTKIRLAGVQSQSI